MIEWMEHFKPIDLKQTASVEDLFLAVLDKIEGEELRKHWRKRCTELMAGSVAPFTMVLALAREFGYYPRPVKE